MNFFAFQFKLCTVPFSAQRAVNRRKQILPIFRENVTNVSMTFKLRNNVSCYDFENKFGFLFSVKSASISSMLMTCTEKCRGFKWAPCTV